MMKIIIFIFILVHFHFLYCAKIPELLECVDDSCKETISTGRVMKSVKPIHGNLDFLKASTKISIKGKSHGSVNTLWLIESDGFYGFIDSSFIKENRESSRNDINVVQNPFYKFSDETEEKDDSLQELKSFSNTKESVSSDINLQNDETENFSEQKQLKLEEKNISQEMLVNKDTINISLNEQKKTTNSAEIVQKNEESDIPKKLEGKIRVKKPENNQNLENKQNVLSKVNDENSQIAEESKKTNKDNLTPLDAQKDKQEHLKSLGKTQEASVQEATINKTIEDSQKIITKEISQTEETSTKSPISREASVKEAKINETIEDSQKEIVAKKPKNNQNLEKKHVLSKVNDENSRIAEESKKTSNENKENATPLNVTEHKPQDQKDTQERFKSLDKTQEASVQEVTINKTIEDSQKVTKEISQAEEKPTKSPVNTHDQAKVDSSKTPMKESVVNESVESPDTIHNKLGSPSEFIKSTDRKLENKAHPEIKESLKVAPELKENASTKESNIPNSPSKEQVDTNVSELLKKAPPIAIVTSKEINEPRKIIQEQVEKTPEIKNPVNPEPVVVVKEVIEPSDSIEKAPIQHIDNTSNPPANEVISEPINTEGKINDSVDPSTKSNSVNSDPWLGSGTKSGSIDYDKELAANIKSPVLKLIIKLDLLAHFLIHSVTERCGLDSNSGLSRFANNWLHMSLENLIFILSSLTILLTVIYAPKLLKFNRDWQSEFLRQSQIVAELESQLQTIEEVRHKLTVQNHNFEKVIEDSKEQINEIQEDAENNKKTVMGEIAKLKKTHEMNMKAVTSDLTNKVRQYELLENEIGERETAIEALEEEKRALEAVWEREKMAMGEVVGRLENELARVTGSRDETRAALQQKITETEKLNFQVQELRQALVDKNDNYVALEKSFENLKIFDGMDYEEFVEKREICLELTNTKERLTSAEDTIQRLEGDLGDKCHRIVELEAAAVESDRQRSECEVRKNEAVALQEQAETKLQVLSDYFKSKEVEMAKTFGHQVIESSQTLDQVDYLKHRIQILEADNSDMGRTILKLKAEIKEAQSFAAKCKSDANEQINELFLKSNTLERNLILEKEESKKLRTKLSHYCGPAMMTATTTTMTSPRGANATYNHYSNKDRPPSRQSMTGEPFMSIPAPQLLPLSSLPQSPLQNNQMSGRNSVNSKKSNNT